jgi:adenylate cyclase
MNYFNKYRFLFFITLFLLLSFGYFNFDRTNGSFDEKLRSTLFHIRGEIKPTGEVVIVDIDEASLEALGQWPFPRVYIAQVLANLANAKVGVIGLDMVFAESDRNSPHVMAKALGVDGDFRDNDALLGTVVAKTPTILGYFFSDEHSKNTLPKVATTFEPNATYGVREFTHLVNNINAISHNAYSSGFFNAFRDTHGKISKIPLLLQYKKRLYPSLVLEMIAAANNTQTITILSEGGVVHGLGLKEFEIPLNESGLMRINFCGAKKSFRYLSFVDVMEGKFDTKEVEGKFILIGTSALTLADIRATPYDLAMPGVEVHANALDNILRGDFLHQPFYIQLLDIVIIALITLSLGYLLLYFGSLWGLFIAIFYTTLLYFILYTLHFKYGLVVNLLYPLLALMCTTLIAFYLNYTQEQEQKEFIKDKFAKKVSPEVVQELLQSPNDTFAAKEEKISIFFSDIRGFTTLSEVFESPQRIIELLNIYLEPMSESITTHQGTIDKFIGDAIMAYWNAPKTIPNHADLALSSAIEQLKRLEIINQELMTHFGVEIEIGMGLHTGYAVVGEMGSQGRSDYTIIGDNVNLTSRIEGLTKYFGAKILISDDIYRELKKTYPLRYSATVVVKGKNRPIKLYEVMDTHTYSQYQQVATGYEEAIESFQAREYDKALRLFQEIESIFSHTTHRHYIDKLTHQSPISQVFVMESK